MVSLDWNSKESVNLLARALIDGGVALGSSDTVLGLLTRANSAGYGKLNAIKRRMEKPYIVLAGKVEEIAELINPTSYCMLENFLRVCWPGPVTVICNTHPDSGLQTGANGTIAVRVPAHQGLQQLLHQTGPLFSTSANLAGQPVPVALQEVAPSLLEQVQAIVLDHSIENHPVTPSTIIDVTTGQLQVIREGAVSIVQLKKWYKRLVLG